MENNSEYQATVKRDYYCGVYFDGNRMMDKVCGNCTHYMGGGDWNLCCNIKHPTPAESQTGMTWPFGHLCYEDTPACDAFEPEITKEDKL